MTPQLNQREKERLEELFSLNLLDSEKIEAFDRITQIVSKAFEIPICLISLIDKDRQWFKSCFGLDGLTEASREVTFCHYVVLEDRAIIIEDTLKDERFYSNPLVTGELGFRFYAGVPLKTKKGNILGTLCLLDTMPRSFTSEDLTLLREYAALAISEVELRGMLKENILLTTAINKTTTGVIITDPNLPNNPTIFVNDAFTQLTGYSEEEVLGQNCKFLQGEESNGETIQQISQAVKNGQGLTIEILNYKKDGTKFWNELKIDAIYDQSGKLSYFMGFQTDITRKKKAELEIEEREQRYRALFYGNHDAVYMMDLEGKFFETNDVCTAITGYSSEELKSMYFQDLLVDEFKQETIQNFMHVIKSREQVEFETQIYHKDRSKHFLSVKALPFVINGVIQGVYGISKDVTHIRENEQQMKIAAKLFESMKEAVLILDEDFTIISINDSLENVIGLPKHKLLNQNMSYITMQQGLEKLCPEIQLTIEKGETWEGQINLTVGKNKEIKPLWLKVESILSVSGLRTNLVCILRDLTEKEYVQKDVQLAGKVQSTTLPEPINNDSLKTQHIFKPAQYVSGDFFYYKWLETKEKLVGIFFDAMGHGVATALQTSALGVLFEYIYKKDIALIDKVKSINLEIINYLTSETFVAGVFFELDVKNKVLEFVPCGVNELFIERDGKLVKYKNPAFLLGMFETADYESFKINIHPGDTIHFLTDGITDVLPKSVTTTDFFQYVKLFCDEHSLIDDATALSIQIKEQISWTIKETVEVDNLGAIDELKNDISMLIEEHLKDKTFYVELAFNEALNNSLKVAKKIQVEIGFTKSQLIFVITDDGPGFDARRKLKEIEEKQESLMEELIWSESGRGIYLMRKFMDEVEYNPKGNQVRLVKRLGATQSVDGDNL
ncbi:PAS domain S-box protein [Bacillus pinisoli]|uniref:PAS domain S-box protein n=1 Tax=Bacillus pinisoli TaxID=2901866 RepID=UPI001FF6064F|nr:PAS domain S-box protein [Bacillus pinisoli]